MRFERHCDWDSECPSHCIKHALSSSDPELQETCDNDHLFVCKDCFNLIESVDLLKTEIQKISDKRDRESKLYEIENCFSDILSWEQHIIRGVQQDKAKTDALKHIENCQAVWIRDWAQKILPGAGLEAQDVRLHYSIQI